MGKKKALLFAPWDIKYHSFEKRIIKWLQENHEVTVVTEVNPHIKGVRCVKCSSNKLYRHINMLNLKNIFYFITRQYVKLYEQEYYDEKLLLAKKKLERYDFDVIIGCELDSSFFVLDFAKDINKVILIIRDTGYNYCNYNILHKIFQEPCMKACLVKYLQICKHIFILPGLKPFFIKKFGLRANANIISNSPEYEPDIEISNKDINNKIRIVYVGGADKYRGLDKIIRLMDYLDERFELDLMILVRGKQLKFLKKLMSKRKNVRIVPTTEPEKVARTISKYDIGIWFGMQLTDTIKYGSSIKFYEYIQARLMLVVGPYYYMGKVTKKFNLGIVADSFNLEDLARKLNRLTREDITRYKENSAKYAKFVLSDKDKIAFNRVIDEIESSNSK